MSTQVKSNNDDLKRIGFIKNAAESSVSFILPKAKPWYDRAQGMYTSCKDATVLKPGLESIEAAIQYYGGPLVEKAQAAAPHLVAEVDAKVDTTVVSAEALWARGRAYVPGVGLVITKVQQAVPDNLEAFHQAREKYFALLEQSLEVVKKKLPALPQDALNQVGTAIAQARAQGEANSRALFERVVAAWETLLANPKVRESVHYSRLKMLLVKKQAVAALNKLQENKTYQSYQGKAMDIAAAVQGNSQYQAYVDPALARITSSSYYTTMTEKVKMFLDSLEDENEMAAINTQAVPVERNVQPPFESQRCPESTDDTITNHVD